jgi:flotillin
MASIMENGSVVVVAGGIAVFVLFMVSMMTLISRCYRRCGADEALVRTGSGGNKVVIGGGVLVFPVIHQLLRVSLRSVKLNVERSGKNALVTGDKIKANVTTELYVKVEPTPTTSSGRHARSASETSTSTPSAISSKAS